MSSFYKMDVFWFWDECCVRCIKDEYHAIYLKRRRGSSVEIYFLKWTAMFVVFGDFWLDYNIYMIIITYLFIYLFIFIT